MTRERRDERRDSRRDERRRREKEAPEPDDHRWRRVDEGPARWVREGGKYA